MAGNNPLSMIVYVKQTGQGALNMSKQDLRLGLKQPSFESKRNEAALLR